MWPCRTPGSSFGSISSPTTAILPFALLSSAEISFCCWVHIGQETVKVNRMTGFPAN